MIPDPDEFADWAPRLCSHCEGPLTWPCLSLATRNGPVHLHANCIWPFVEVLVDDLLRIAHQHPEQLNEDWGWAKKFREKDDK